MEVAELRVDRTARSAAAAAVGEREGTEGRAVLGVNRRHGSSPKELELDCQMEELARMPTGPNRLF
jgi:hypothetical protein